jgi:hypothetical protein
MIVYNESTREKKYIVFNIDNNQLYNFDLLDYNTCIVYANYFDFYYTTDGGLSWYTPQIDLSSRIISYAFPRNENVGFLLTDKGEIYFNPNINLPLETNSVGSDNSIYFTGHSLLFLDAKAENRRIELFNTSGQLVFSTKTSEKEVDLSTFQMPQIYFLRIYEDNQTHAFQILLKR